MNIRRAGSVLVRHADTNLKIRVHIEKPKNCTTPKVTFEDPAVPFAEKIKKVNDHGDYLRAVYKMPAATAAGSKNIRVEYDDRSTVLVQFDWIP